MILNASRLMGFEVPQKLQVSEILACSEFTLESRDDHLFYIQVLDGLWMESYLSKSKG